MFTNRQLAAIMFTDIVGYTSLMGEDEQKAFDTIQDNRRLQQPLIEKFNGKWIKELGDGVLASFHTATDAVYCALSIQKKVKAENDFLLRIGIHLGEVVFENNDVLCLWRWCQYCFAHSGHCCTRRNLCYRSSI